MRRDDARRLDHATLEAMRERAVGPRAEWRKPGSCCSCYWRQSFGGLRVAGTVSARWLGSVESQAAVRSPTETRRQEAAVDLRYGDAKEPITAQVCVCVVDARDGGDADQG